MPNRLYIPADVRALLDELPEQIRQGAAALFLLLLSEPVPAEAKHDPDVPEGYRINAALFTVYYGVYDDEIRI